MRKDLRVMIGTFSLKKMKHGGQSGSLLTLAVVIPGIQTKTIATMHLRDTTEK